jgi:hypothetical protein
MSGVRVPLRPLVKWSLSGFKRLASLGEAISMKKQFHLCEELQFIIDCEMTAGNVLSSQPELADWPSKGSIFVSLERDLHRSHYQFPTGIKHSICTDPHLGWHDECDCLLHGHLLVAGTTHPPSS